MGRPSLNICRVVHAVLPEYWKTTLRAGIGYKLAERGHKVCAVSNRFPGQPSFEVIGGLIPVYRVRAWILPEIRYPITDMRELMRVLRSVIRAHEVEVLHYHPFEYPIAWSALLVKDIPKVISIEGVPGLNWFYGRLPVDVAGLAYSITLGRLVLSACSRVVVFGSHIARYVRALGVPWHKIVVIGYGIDDEKFSVDKERAREAKRAELGISEDELVVLFVGRLYPVKGIKTLLEAADEVTSWHDYVRFLIVGDGPLWPLVAEAARRNPRIMPLGFREDVPELMAASDIFVLPSLAEGLPYSLLEAAFSGLPIVATAVGCIPDVVINGRTGLLVPRGSSRRLAEAIKEFIRHPELREELSRNVEEHVRKKYAWQSVLEQYERLFQEVIEEGP